MKNIFLAFLIGFSAVVAAQNSITGIVMDNKNQPLKNVSVYAPELHKGTTTDENGKYNLNRIPSGTFKLTFVMVGYATQNNTLVIKQSENTLNVIMEEMIFQMDEVIVSTAFNKLQSQNVMKVDHASIRSLQENGNATLIEGIATLPGVSQISTGTSIGKPVIRGLSGNRVLVYSQGVRIENQQFGEEHGLGLNDSGIESVEVIKGPASLLYGSDALGGVLYFNPEKFANAHSSSANFSQRVFSNTLGSATNLGFKTSTDNWKFLGRGSYTTHSDYQIPDGKRVTNTRFNENDFKTGIGYSDGKFSTVFRYNYNSLDIGIPETGVSEQTSSKKTDFPKQGIENHLLSLNSIFFLENSKLDVNLGFIENDRKEFEDSESASLYMILKTFNYDVKYHLPSIGKLESIVGVQGMIQNNANYGSEYLIPDATTSDIGVFGTFNYQWNSSALQTGLRYDTRNITTQNYGELGEEGSFTAITKNYESFNASAGFKTKFGEQITLRLNVASGFRAPNLAELTSNGVHEGTNRYEVGNPNLKTEQNLQTDINLEYNNSHFEFFVNGFYNKINNYIYSSPTGDIRDDNVVYEYIQNNAYLFGGEIGLHFHPHPLDWLHFNSSFELVTGKRDNGDYLPFIPANNWNNAIRIDFQQAKWLSDVYASFDVAYTFDQRNVSGFETQTNDYTLLGIGLGGKVTIGKTKFVVNLNGNNLLDKKYIAHLSRLKTDGIPNIGRNVVVGVSFSI